MAREVDSINCRLVSYSKGDAHILCYEVIVSGGKKCCQLRFVLRYHGAAKVIEPTSSVRRLSARLSGTMHMVRQGYNSMIDSVKGHVGLVLKIICQFRKALRLEEQTKGLAGFSGRIVYGVELVAVVVMIIIMRIIIIMILLIIILSLLYRANF